jgi:hypothetical protein
MADLKRRLTQKDITLKEMLIISYDYYKKSSGDDKEWRASIDITSARLIRRQGFNFNKSTKQWEQNSREIKFTFLIKTNPVSYQRTDKLKYHYYPVVFLIKDISKAENSPIKWRTGSLFKPTFAKKGMSKEQREKIQNKNLSQQIQLQFFYELEWVLWEFNLLYGRNWATYPPRKANSSLTPFFDKHAFFIASRIILPLITSSKRFRLQELWKNNHIIF